MKTSLSIYVLYFVISSCTFTASTPQTGAADGLKLDEIADCTPETIINSICKSSPTLVRPTQFALGYRDVEDKKTKIRKIKHDGAKLEEYLRHKIIPAIKGPNSVYFIVDGHHTSRALAEESVFRIYLRVQRDESSHSLPEFYARLASDGLIWLYNEHGQGLQNPEDLPTNIMNLKNDTYRSLAEDAQKRGAFAERPVYFQQFMWANYFRPLIDRDTIESNYDSAVKFAVKLAQRPEASHLPGYIH